MYKFLIFSICGYFLYKGQSDVVGTWITCNENNSYYTSDTIIFSDNVNYYYNNNCCRFIEWKINAKKMIFSNNHLCNEPPVKKSEERKIKYRNEVIEVYLGNKMEERFKVIDINKKEIEEYPYLIRELTLWRLK